MPEFDPSARRSRWLRWRWQRLFVPGLIAAAVTMVGSAGMPVAAQSMTATATLTLTATDGGTQWGHVKLVDDGSTTRVIVALHDAPTGDYIAHIHTGTCASYDGDPVFPLQQFAADGRSRTSVALGFSEMLKDGYLIDIHPFSSDASKLFDPATAIVCGELAGAATSLPTGSQISVTTPPQTGVGPLGGQYWSTMLPASLAAIAACSALLAIEFRRRSVALSPATRRLYAMTGHRL
jgi:hypothetical protein